VPVPFGVTGPVLVEAGKRFEQRGRTWERFRWAAGLAAAAGLIVVVVLSLGRGDQQNAARPAAASAGTGAVAEAGGAAADSGAPVPFHGLERQQDVSYDEDGIRAVAAGAGQAIVAADEKAGGQAPAPTAVPAEAQAGALMKRTMFTSAATAKRCIQQSGLTTNGPRDVLIRMIQAKFEGTPAYIAVFAEGPGAGQPADHVVIWVVSTQDCGRILTTFSQRLAQS